MRVQGASYRDGHWVQGLKIIQLISESAYIDRQIKFRLPPKTNVALKYLRTQLNLLLASQLRGKPLTESQVLWMEVAMAVMGKLKLEKDSDEQQQNSILNVVLH